MTTTADQFAALPEPVQEQLVRMARTAAGMSTAEKEQARFYLVAMAMEAAKNGSNDRVATAEIVTASAHVVRALDEASGSAASWLVGA